MGELGAPTVSPPPATVVEPPQARLSTSVPPTGEDDAAPPPRSAAVARSDDRISLFLVVLCMAVWLAGNAEDVRAAQRQLAHHALDGLDVGRLGAGRVRDAIAPRGPASLSSATSHGVARFVYEWTLGRSGTMSRQERVEIERIRRELDAARMRAHTVIAALHARDVTEQHELLNRRFWSDWRARRLLKELEAAPPDEIAGVLAEAARPACTDRCASRMGDGPLVMAAAD